MSPLQNNTINSIKNKPFHQVCCSIWISCNQHVLIHTWVAIFLSWLWDKQRGSLCQNQLGRTRRCSGSVPAAGFLQCSVIKPQQEWLVNCNPWTLEQQPHCGEPSWAPTPPPSPLRKQVSSSCLSCVEWLCRSLVVWGNSSDQSVLIRSHWEHVEGQITLTFFMSSSVGEAVLDAFYYSCVTSAVLYCNGNVRKKKKKDQQKRYQATFFPL